MPEPITTPRRLWSPLAKSTPQSRAASSAAHIPRWQKRSIRFASRPSISFVMSQSRTSPAKRTVQSSVCSNDSMVAMPERPSTRAFQVSGTLWPRSVTAPRPETTTRLSSMVRMIDGETVGDPRWRARPGPASSGPEGPHLLFMLALMKSMAWPMFWIFSA